MDTKRVSPSFSRRLSPCSSRCGCPEGTCNLPTAVLVLLASLPNSESTVLFRPLVEHRHWGVYVRFRWTFGAGIS